MEKSILAIINERQLVSVMNKTKWHKLIEAVATLPFQPAYQLKMITQELVPPTFSKHMTYVGDWQHLEIKSWHFAAIEWLKIRPILYRPIGQLLPDEKLDITEEVQQLLEEGNYYFDEVDGDFIIYGYMPK